MQTAASALSPFPACAAGVGLLAIRQTNQKDILLQEISCPFHSLFMNMAVCALVHGLTMELWFCGTDYKDRSLDRTRD